jgi:HEPN domain-containing protein
MHSPKEIAKAFLIESEVDIEVARLTFVNSFYSRTIFFSQQAAEKAAKAVLALYRVLSSDHNTATIFKAILNKGPLPEYEKISETIEHLEKYGAKARFPLFQRQDLPLWIPSREFKEHEAFQALAGAEFVFRSLQEFLEPILSNKESLPVLGKGD